MAELNLRLAASKAVQKSAERIRANSTTWDTCQLEQELNSIRSSFMKFEVNHDKLVAVADKSEFDSHEELWYKVESCYNDAVALIARQLKEKTSMPVAVPVQGNEHPQFALKLDPLVVPSFDGQLHNWLAFRDLFEALIHTQQYPEAYKLAKLRQAVSAEAVPLIGSHYSGGYEEVWKALNDRYNSRRHLADAHVTRLLNMKVVYEDGQKSLLAVVDQVSECLRALRVMQLPVASWDAILVPIVLSKLPATVQRHWNISLTTTEIPSLEELLKFLEKRAHSLACGGGTTPSPDLASGAHSDARKKPRALQANLAKTELGQCMKCGGDHRIMRCPSLLALNPEDRFKALKTSNLCFNCLRSGHAAKQCSSGGCRRCGRKHNTLFCRAAVGAPIQRNMMQDQQSPPASNLVSCLTHGQPMILLATATACAIGASSIQRNARILCDPGSQVSFVTEKLANQLQLRRQRHSVAVEGIGAAAHTHTSGIAELRLQSQLSDFAFNIKVLIIPSITSLTPGAFVETSSWTHLHGLPLADPHFGIPGPVDILLGADVWGLIVEAGIVKGEAGQPYAQCTRLGWVVFGPAHESSSTSNLTKSLHARICDSERPLEELIRNFWKWEELPSNTDATEDVECEQFFATTHTRTPEGRYVVQLPFSKISDLGDSYTHALQQFLRNERRLAGNDELHSRYIEFMREYSALGHMERVTNDIRNDAEYYIPHHAVLEKFRVVFNASARTSKGVSLNDRLKVGPTIQAPLVHILFRFRLYRVALIADIEKMFRQVEVDAVHRDYQRIFWREAIDDPVAIYRLKTVTYGMACSPFNAVRALHQCAYDNSDLVTDPDMATAARNAILTSFYVDDFLISFDSCSEAITAARNVDTILEAGKFKLRKWNSNNADALKKMAGSANPQFEQPIGNQSATVLGLHWDPAADELFFGLEVLPHSGVITKRRVLSEVAKLFDPTGLIAPVVVKGKIFIQTLWKAGLVWDAHLPQELEEAWLRFRDGWHTLKQVRVPRWLGISPYDQLEIHGFADASLRAYAAVIYIKTTSLEGHHNVALLTARTRVAPLRGATMPRLELSAAHLLAETFDDMRTGLDYTNVTYYMWSDSTIALAWIKKSPEILKPFVSNRVRRIQELTDPMRWFYVRSAQNPADCASRGMMAWELAQHDLWWSGPYFLRENPSSETGLTMPTAEDNAIMKKEERVTTLLVHVPQLLQLTTRRTDGETIPLTDRFSSLQRLLRTVALLLRWLPRYRPGSPQPIGAREMEEALQRLIVLDQDNYFSKDIHHLKHNGRVTEGSSLKPLNPYLDDHGIMRLGGRIGLAHLPHNSKFPIILPKSSALVNLLIADAHSTTLHGGVQLMLQTLRSRFWVIHGRQAVRSYLHRCVVCRRHRGSSLTQQMAALPGQRVQAARPFLKTGVDYCGPFTLRIGSKRSRATTKAYLAIFVCMATKAVHIEMVEDLSSQAFLDAFTRFVGRRGICSDLFSDNGTTFVGANRILKEDLAAWHADQNQIAIAHMGTNWHFITPNAPHQGGLWEAAVKSAKRHLTKVVGTQSLWPSQLHTLAVRIEACLNSRPLYPLTDDPDDRYALTPGDFLIGQPIVAVPEPNTMDVPPNRLKHWQWLRQLHQQFWHRWNEEYLATLQRRNKWFSKHDNLEIGDIVLVRREGLPPTNWRMGKIIEIHPGKDGLVRNVTLKTKSGLCTRAIQRLVRLVDFEPDGSTGQDV